MRAASPKKDATRDRILHGVALGFGLLVAVALLITGELAYRRVKTGSIILAPATWIADPVLIYRLNPAHPEYHDSFRRATPARVHQAGVRVVCMGGSTTFGHNVAVSEAWPHALEETLVRHGIDAEVINAGVPGYGSRQLLLRYRHDIAPLGADVVVLYEGWNRTGALVDPIEWVPYAVARPEDGWLRRTGLAIGRHSLLFRTLAQQAVAWWQVRGAAAGPAEPMWSMDPHHDLYFSDMHTLVEEIQARGQRPALVLYPALYHEDMSPEEIEIYRAPIWRGYQPAMLTELERKHAALRRIAHDTGATLVDVQGALAQYRGAARVALFQDEMHPTVLGNRLVGEAIGDALVDSGIGRHATQTRSRP